MGEGTDPPNDAISVVMDAKGSVGFGVGRLPVMVAAVELSCT